MRIEFIAGRGLTFIFEEHEAKEIGAGIHEKYLRMAQELAAACR